MGNRPCGPRKSKKNPDAYSKDELMNLAMKHLNYSKSKANKSSVEELCAVLDKKRKEDSNLTDSEVRQRIRDLIGKIKYEDNRVKYTHYDGHIEYLSRE